MVPRADTVTIPELQALSPTADMLLTKEEHEQRFADHFKHDSNTILQIIADTTALLATFLKRKKELGNGINHDEVVELEKTINLMSGAISSLVKIASNINIGEETVDKQYQPITPILPEVCLAVLGKTPKVKLTIIDNQVDAAIDRAQIWRALLNLVKNANRILVKELALNPSFEPQITLKVEESEDYIVMSVEDNGPGIHEDAKQHIFKPGYTTQEGKQHGFGLYNVWEICELHGGRVSFESTPGKTVFKITIPKGHPPVISENTELPVLTNRQIFIVEDTPVVSELLMEQLKALGADPQNISQCADLSALQDAVNLADRERDCLLISDNDFPGTAILVGDAASAAFCVRNKFPQALVIACTGNPNGLATDLRCERLDKPHDMRTLKNLLTKMGNQLTAAST